MDSHDAIYDASREHQKNVQKERCRILDLREAYVAGVTACGYPESVARARAERTYPMPTITRPRVVRRLNYLYRINGRSFEGAWPLAPNVFWERICSGSAFDAFQDLIANPTETVPASETADPWAP